MVRYLMGIDDTDNLKSCGAGALARQLGALLGVGVVRLSARRRA
jgi:hypothetical protein